MEKRHVIAAGIHDPIWQDAPQIRRHHGLQLWVLASISLFIVIGSYLVAATVLSRRDYGTFSFWGTPDRINYCGRRYYSAGSVHGTPALFLATVSGHPSWRTVGHTFVLRPIEAAVTANVAAGETCTMAVYVPTGRDTYVRYELSGGP